jgi:hypothetical protein
MGAQVMTIPEHTLEHFNLLIPAAQEGKLRMLRMIDPEIMMDYGDDEDAMSARDQIEERTAKAAIQELLVALDAETPTALKLWRERWHDRLRTIVANLEAPYR